MPKDVNDPSKGSQFRHALAFTLGAETLSGIFVLVGNRYQLAAPTETVGEIQLRDINDAVSGGAAWQQLQTRLDEMVSHTGVSRSGDIVLVFNIKDSYATVNDATEEELNGWHGSPTQAESVTPLVYATPGYGWYAADNSALPSTAKVPVGPNGLYRNSNIRASLKALTTSLVGGTP
jgi:hypothetical protein